MSRNYKFHNPQGLYFVSFSVVHWLPIFREEAYCNILLDCLRFCQTRKGLQLFSWCIMKHHVHLVFRSTDGQHPGNLLGDFKRFTANKIIKTVLENHKDPNRDYYLSIFSNAAFKSSNVKHYQVWQHDNHPIEVWTPAIIWQKINYIHQNPVAAGIVNTPTDYIYSSAIDYFGGNGLLDNIHIWRD